MHWTEISILVIDDNAEDGRLLEQNLAQSGHSRRLHFCRSTAEAKEILKTSEYDIILTDHRPKTIDTFQLIRYLSKHDDQTPVVVLTANGTEKLASEAIKQGAYDYLTKEELGGTSISHILDTVLERRKLRKEAREAADRLKQLAVSDSLTEVHNRRYFQDCLVQEFARSHRYHRALALMMIDLDSFKAVNDRAGHVGGDTALIEVARILQEGLRRVDTVARYGGDEFAIILPETGLQSAINLAHRLRERIMAHSLTLDASIGRLTVSIGVAALSPEIDNPQEMIARADRALYQAKKMGRNRVCSGLSLKSNKFALIKNET